MKYDFSLCNNASCFLIFALYGNKLINSVGPYLLSHREYAPFSLQEISTSELQIPVKCPVSGIIKQRKVLGVECFEVAWEHLDGLETSIVPADLLER